MPLMITEYEKSLVPMVTAAIVCDECGQIASLHFRDETTARANYADSGWTISTDGPRTTARCLMCHG